MSKIETAERVGVATQFASRLFGLQGIEDVILMSTEPDLQIAVMLTSLNLEQELHIQAVFAELSRNLRDSTSGDVFAYVVGEDERPQGDSLLP